MIEQFVEERESSKYTLRDGREITVRSTFRCYYWNGQLFNMRLLSREVIGLTPEELDELVEYIDRGFKPPVPSFMQR